MLYLLVDCASVASHDLGFVQEVVGEVEAEAEGEGERHGCYRLFKGQLTLLEGGVEAYREIVAASVASQQRAIN